MNMIVTLLIIIWTVLITVLVGTFVVVGSLFSNYENFMHRVARVWGRLILWASRIPVTVKGLTHIDSSKSYIYMSNHQSNYDIPVLLAHLKVQFRWLAKAELFKIPIFGRAMRNVGYISIDRSNRRAAFESLNQAANMIQSGISVLIFPEGTRSTDGEIRPFKKGGFVLAVDAGVPIVPIVIHGTYSIMPKGRIRIRPGHVVLEILKPVETTEYTRKTKDELMAKVRSLVCDAFDKGIQDKAC